MEWNKDEPIRISSMWNQYAQIKKVISANWCHWIHTFTWFTMTQNFFPIVYFVDVNMDYIEMAQFFGTSK
jgi:hypothetical protein